MGDNRNLAALTGNAAADEVSYSGDTAVVQVVRDAEVTGAEGSKTVQPLDKRVVDTDKARRVVVIGDPTTTDVALVNEGGALTVVNQGLTSIQGAVPHDDGTTGNPLLTGGYAKAAAPTDVSADGDAVSAWFLRNGAQAVNLTAAGALIPGNATDGLKVNLGADNDVTVASLPLPAGAATEAELDAQTALLTTIDADTSRIPALGQATMANSVPVAIASNQGAVPVSGTVAVTGVATAANQATGNTALSNIEGSTSSLLSNVDGAATLSDSGAAALVIRDDALTTLTPVDGDYERMRVDSVGRLWTNPSGVTQPVSGTFWQATQPVSGTVAVTGVATETTLAAIKTAVELIDTVGAGTAATAQRNTLASDDPAVAALQIIDDWDETDRAKVNIVAGQAGVTAGAGAVAANTPRVTHASDDPAVTSLQLIDDAIFAEDTASADGHKGVALLAVRRDTAAISTSTDGDYAQLNTDNYGRLRVTSADSISMVRGDVYHDDAETGSASPVKVGSVGRSALPTAVANDDRANAISDLFGRLLVSHIDPAMQITKAFNATTTQTGIDVWDPAAGKKIAITSVVIGTYGTTAARVILWFGDNADTTYSAGTDQVLLIASFAPSATAKPGLVFTPAVPIFCTTADRELHVTTDAGISIDVTATGYEY